MPDHHVRKKEENRIRMTWQSLWKETWDGRDVFKDMGDLPS